MFYSNAHLVANGSKWRGVLQYKDPETDKWRKKTKTLGSKGKRAAERELEEWRAAMEEEAQRFMGNDGHEITVSEYLQIFIEGKKPSVEPSTYAEYSRLLSKLISPHLGNVPLRELKPDAVRSWIVRVSEDFAPVTCKKALTVLRSAMNQAIDNELLTKDPTRGVKPPKQGRPKPNALDMQGVMTVLSVMDSAPQTPALLGIRIAMLTGLREGEICALRWRDVDFEQCTLTVESSLGRDGSRYYLKDPKNVGSARVVYFGDALADALEQRAGEVRAACRAAGAPFDGSLFVLGGIDGGFMRPQHLGNRWRALADALELKGTRGTRPTFHDLRHTFATQAVAAGIDIKTISAALGHSNAAMTLNTYADSTREQKKLAARVMQERYRGALTEGGNDGKA